MANDGEVVFSVDLETKRAKSSLKDMTAAIDKESKKWDDSVKESADKMGTSFASALKGIGVAISAAAIGKKLLDIGKDALQAASDLEEVQNVVDVTFGESASTIDKWAKQAGASFGLTELQAKKFASTLGAMMKSAGMSGNEIVEMSTDLAGLAADMASFYNLDFETAFQKIRSGISGETEPLKQLGINMSVANLEAYALSQGITKAFDKMTQGEQTMLRYQYLMQATADAQGDFARTSDSYANSLRTLELEINTLKSRLGEVLVPAFKDVIQIVNQALGALTPEEGYRTVLDDFAEIDLQSASKLAEIRKTADEARALSNTLGEISKWSSTSGQNTLKNAFDGLPESDKVSAWNELFGVVAGNAQAIIAASNDGDGTALWLQGIADSANTLDPTNADAWGELLTSLGEGLSGLSDTVGGRNVLRQLTEEYLAMGVDSAAGNAGLMALGYSSEQIAAKQEQWLKTCKNLVKTIPELSSIIDIQTGKVDGGKTAVDEYVKAWEQGQEKMIAKQAVYAKEMAIAEKRAALVSLDLARKVAQSRANMAYDAFMAEGGPRGAQTKAWKEAKKAYEEQQNLAAEAAQNYKDEAAAIEEAVQELELYYAEVDKMPDPMNMAADATDGLTDSTKELTDEVKNDLVKSLQDVTDAYNNLSEYIEKVHAETASSIANTIKGFENVLTPADKARESMKDLTKQMEDMVAQGEDTSSLQKTFQGLEGSVPSIQSMTAALESQLAFLDRYNKALEAAKARGVSDAILAALADGSPESLDYLEALGNGAMNEGDIETLNKKYAEVQSKSEGLANTLTETKLAVDDTFTGLVNKATEAVQALNQSAAAADATGATVSAVITALQEKQPEVDLAVDAINASIARLGSTMPSFSWGGGIFSTIQGLFRVNGSHATGLDFVPFDNYIAQLHEGESILSAEEANIWRQFKYGQMSSRNVDYDALGATMRDNMKTGGNVYLDGQTVGRVISASQANDYRRLERSGWQS